MVLEPKTTSTYVALANVINQVENHVRLRGTIVNRTYLYSIRKNNIVDQFH